MVMLENFERIFKMLIARRKLINFFIVHNFMNIAQVVLLNFTSIIESLAIMAITRFSID